MSDKGKKAGASAKKVADEKAKDKQAKSSPLAESSKAKKEKEERAAAAEAKKVKEASDKKEKAEQAKSAAAAEAKKMVSTKAADTHVESMIAAASKKVTDGAVAAKVAEDNIASASQKVADDKAAAAKIVASESAKAVSEATAAKNVKEAEEKAKAKESVEKVEKVDESSAAEAVTSAKKVKEELEVKDAAWPENNRNYWADMAFQLGGSKEYYDRVLMIEDPTDAEVVYKECKQGFEAKKTGWPEGNRNYWADQVFLLDGSQEYFERVKKHDNPNAALAEYMKCKHEHEANMVLMKKKDAGCCVVQ